MIRSKPEINISESFAKAGIKPNDTVMIHADTGIAAHYNNSEPFEKINCFIKDIINYFGDLLCKEWM